MQLSVNQTEVLMIVKKKITKRPASSKTVARSAKASLPKVIRTARPAPKLATHTRVMTAEGWKRKVEAELKKIK